MALRAAEVIGSEPESFSFELDRFERDGEQGLEVRGRWFGVRGRRFVRPTLTMRIDGAKHRLLADLEHKPWAAKDGEEWVASFSPAPPAGDTRDIELSVARDIVIPLSAPASITSRRRPTGATAAPPRPEKRPTARPVDRVQKAMELERAKARDLRRALDDAEADRGRLAAQRAALTAERDGMRHEQARERAQIAELEQRLRSSEANAGTGLSETRSELEAERAESERLRNALSAVVAERDRLARELEAAVAEQRSLAAQSTHPRAIRPETARVARALSARPVAVTDPRRRRETDWVARALVLVPLTLVLVILALVLHLF